MGSRLLPSRTSARTAPASSCRLAGEPHVVGEPLLARAERDVGGDERRAESSPAASRVSTFSSRPFAITVEAPERAARFAASTLDSIPPRAERAARAAGHRFERRIARLRRAHERRRRIAARVRRVESRLIGEQHEHVGLDEIRDERAERVVVAEADLVGRDRVVLVDDRDHARARAA